MPSVLDRFASSEINRDYVAYTPSQARDARAQADKADAKFGEYTAEARKKLDGARKETGDALTGAVDKFDKNVSEGAAKTKSTLGSWFGGK